MAEQFSHEVQDALQTPSDVHTEDHSEAMLAKLDDFLKVMGRDYLGFLYEKWRNHPACLPGNRSRWSSQPVCGDGWQEKTDSSGGLYKLKIINWGFLWGARGRLDNLAKAAGAMDGAAGAVTAKLQGAWSSKAGEAAAAKVNDLRAASMDYQSLLTQLRDHVDGARSATRSVVEKLAGFADSSDVGGKPIVDRYGKYAIGGPFDMFPRDQYATYIDEMGRILESGTWASGFSAKEEATFLSGLGQGLLNLGTVSQSAESLHQPGQVRLTDGDNRWSDQICRELNDFCECYFLTVGNLRRRIEETIRAVESAWDELNSATITMTADPFGKLSLTGASQPPPEEKKPDADKKPEAKQPVQTAGGPSDTGGGPGGGGPGGGAYEPPAMPQPPTPGATDPASAIPETPQVPGTPQVPTTGAPETVTITDGDRSISVQSPDGQGKVSVTVDDGSGKPKTYELDFGQSTPGAVDPATGKPVVDPVTGQPVPDPATGRPVLDPVSGQPVPGQDGVQHIQASPDGKAVIHDGDLTITAERSADDPDTVKITVDDGTGEPVTYTVDYQDPAAPTVGQPEAKPVASAFAPGEPGARVLPGESQPGGPASAPQGLSGEPVAAAQGVPAQQNGGYSEYQGGGFAAEAQPAYDGQGGGSQSTFAASDQSGAWGAAGSVFDDLDRGADQGDLSGASGDTHASGSGEAGLATAQPGAGDHAGGQAGSGLGGMPMGGMGGGGSSGGSGDSERAGSQWRTSGQLFDDDYATAESRISSAIDGGR
ncbi:hypothetical protein [Actinokineospora globicatena]|uniref:hypothetical protein n=1 Tax=Actinokineospora globicatena TaxID=103729 RepID=UPI0020A511ED|nr:hypothetical protein [Actinokineospora globicatena]MCP2301884.1 hypothetical protein [Actinokineospora globicatena]GLW76457.1 hypothetical protein Aglo01_09390 [Actinokineospora globicatena]GLW83292.1 hypothetical protein Aglo02_09320 [Actinokineospora globicatena]